MFKVNNKDTRTTPLLMILWSYPNDSRCYGQLTIAHLTALTSSNLQENLFNDFNGSWLHPNVDFPMTQTPFRGLLPYGLPFNIHPSISHTSLDLYHLKPFHFKPPLGRPSKISRFENKPKNIRKYKKNRPTSKIIRDAVSHCIAHSFKPDVWIKSFIQQIIWIYWQIVWK